MPQGGPPPRFNLERAPNGFQRGVRFFDLVLLLIVLMITGNCARQTSGDLQPSLTVIKTLIPDRGVTGVKLHGPIQVVFTKDMDPSTINDTTFHVRDAAGNSMAGTVSSTARTAQIAVSGGLNFQTTYIATMTTGVADPQGEALKDPVAWSFTTEKAPLSFGANVRVSDYAPAAFFAGSFSSGECSMFQSGGMIYGVWYDDRLGSDHIYFSKSTDGGSTFGSNVKVDDDSTPRDHEFPCITVDALGNIYVVWDDRRGGTKTASDIYFAKSTDGGITFGPNVKINDDDTETVQLSPNIAVGTDGTIYVAWKDYRNQILDDQGHPDNSDIYVSTSTDGGLTFSPNQKANDDAGTANQFHPAIAVDSTGKLYLEWRDWRNGDADPDIYFTTARRNGSRLIFGPNIRINDDTVPANQHDPTIKIGPGGEVLFMWVDHREGGNSSIYFSKSTDGGVTFSPNLAVSEPNTGGQDLPSLAVNTSGLIAVTWQNSTTQPDGSVLIDIQATTSTDGGATFHSSVLVNDDATSAVHRESNIAIDDHGRVYVIWSDQRNGPGSGKYDIYSAIGQ
jgi:hypothetical protein